MSLFSQTNSKTWPGVAGHLDVDPTWKLTAPIEAAEIERRLLAVCGSLLDVLQAGSFLNLVMHLTPDR